MTPEVRAEMEARAERCVRRGELAEAVGIYESLLQEHPSDEALQRKLAQVSESLQPNELQAIRAAVPKDAPRTLPPAGPEQEGERLFALGDYAGAAAAYRRALQERPGSQLIRERLEELYRLARSAPRHSPTDIALPRGREDILRALLDRISARKRVRLG